jgi:hypothetical protein
MTTASGFSAMPGPSRRSRRMGAARLTASIASQSSGSFSSGGCPKPAAMPALFTSTLICAAQARRCQCGRRTVRPGSGGRAAAAGLPGGIAAQASGSNSWRGGLISAIMAMVQACGCRMFAPCTPTGEQRPASLHVNTQTDLADQAKQAISQHTTAPAPACRLHISVALYPGLYI